ncbi:MAG: ASCH domain-containing protein [Paludibaculum sp.]
MKLISLWEPWATLMAVGAKRIETRSWGTSYRGWLAIQASKAGLPKHRLATFLDQPAFRLALSGERLSPGCIVAVVRLLDCCPMQDFSYLSQTGVFSVYPELDTQQEREFGDFSKGRWAWVTEDLVRLPKPIPFRAKQGLVDLPFETVTELRNQCAQLSAQFENSHRESKTEEAGING